MFVLLCLLEVWCKCCVAFDIFFWYNEREKYDVNGLGVRNVSQCAKSCFIFCRKQTRKATRAVPCVKREWASPSAELPTWLYAYPCCLSHTLTGFDAPCWAFPQVCCLLVKLLGKLFLLVAAQPGPGGSCAVLCSAVCRTHFVGWMMRHKYPALNNLSWFNVCF